MNTSTTIGRVLCAALLAAVLQAQLPPEVELDRQMLAAREARAEGDWLQMGLSLLEVKELGEEHGLELPPEFRLLYAELRLTLDDYDEAIEGATEYLGLVGRGGARYEDALRLLNRAEREKAERAAQAERAKADAEARAKRQKAEEEKARAEAEAARKRAEAAAAEAAREKDCDEVADEDGYLSPSDRCWLVLEKPAGCLAWKPLGFWVRSGTWNKQCPEGRAEGSGTLTWRSFTRDWSKGRGTMRAGKPTGRWVFRWDDGGRTEGAVRDGLRQGLWTYENRKTRGWGRYNYLDDERHGEEKRGQGASVHAWRLWEHGMPVKNLGP